MRFSILLSTLFPSLALVKDDWSTVDPPMEGGSCPTSQLPLPYTADFPDALEEHCAGAAARGQNNFSRITKLNNLPMFLLQLLSPSRLLPSPTVQTLAV